MLRAVEHVERTDTGRARRANEDSYYARSPVFVVADGMGGAQAGEVASRVAVEAFERALDGRPIMIGRADDSTLVLDDDYASTRHARISQSGNEWYVEDLGSTNGTYLDRTKVSGPTRVTPGSPIRIGKTVIELRS